MKQHISSANNHWTWNILAFALMVVFTHQVAAQAHRTSMDDLGAGTLLYPDDETGLYEEHTALHSDVDIQVNGLAARVTLIQQFTNDTAQWREAIYVFPLPENAAVDRLRMKIGDRIIVGKIEEQKKAAATYKAAKKQGRQTSLVEQQRPNMFTTRVANIPPHGRVDIEIAYLQTLEYDQGEFSLRFPMTVTPRYIPGTPLPEYSEKSVTDATGWAQNTNQVKDAANITPPMHSDSSTNRISIHASINAGFPLGGVVSSSHTITASQRNDSWTIGLDSNNVAADRDFILSWRPVTGSEPGAALFSEQQDESTYALIMIMPPQNLAAATQPREAIFVIDTSGSMGGESIRQARSALKLALNRLGPQDRFNVVEFNSQAQTLYDRPRQATKHAIATALNWVSALQANGGTEMQSALEKALNKEHLSDDSLLLRQIIFITDGAVGNETGLFQMILDNLGNDRLFTVGIGSAPNSYFMRKAAEHGRGTFIYIADTSEVAAQMGTLFSKLEQPALTNISIDWQGVTASEISPNPIPDLYQGEPVILTAKLSDLNGTMRVSGQTAGQHWQRELTLAGGGQHTGVSTLWARNKIEYLSDQITQLGESSELADAVLATALEHHLVSKYTSLVAVDVTPARPAGEKLHTTALPNNLPHGTPKPNTVGYPAGATSKSMHLLIGLLSLLLAAVIGFRRLPGTRFCGLFNGASA